MQKMELVLQFLRTTYPAAILEIHTFPSGAAMVDIRFGDLFVVVAYSPRDGFGASVLKDDDSGFAGHDHAFATAEEVNDYLSRVLRGEPS